MDDQSFESTQVPDRRTFFKRFVNGLGAAIGAIVGVPLAGLYALPAFSTPTPHWKECGAVNDFPVPVNWSPQARRFFSPCHGGVFDADGRVLTGPPPRPLDRYEIKIENGVLFAGPAYQVNERLERLS